VKLNVDLFPDPAKPPQQSADPDDELKLVDWKQRR
jgi:hypothetical protein